MTLQAKRLGKARLLRVELLAFAAAQATWTPNLTTGVMLAK
jgi:hypothetical protein